MSRSSEGQGHNTHARPPSFTNLFAGISWKNLAKNERDGQTMHLQAFPVHVH